MIRRLLRYVRQAGAKEESDTERDGFLSHKAETHAAGVGVGAGWLLTATGNEQLLGVVLPAITGGLRGKKDGPSVIYRDVLDEPHYAIASLVVGGVLGLLV